MPRTLAALPVIAVAAPAAADDKPLSLAEARDCVGKTATVVFGVDDCAPNVKSGELHLGRQENPFPGPRVLNSVTVVLAKSEQTSTRSRSASRFGSRTARVPMSSCSGRTRWGSAWPGACG